MNDVDIIKALEEELKTALIINRRFEESNDTENPEDHKFIALLSDTIDLIKRQQAEIEELTYKLECLLCHSTGNLLSKSTYTLRTMECAVTDYIEISCDEAGSEAIKEFAKRLKESAFDCDVSFGYGKEHYTEVVAVIEIDNLVKEMT